jgi:DNA-binding transcriptional ArsR family regulator
VNALFLVLLTLAGAVLGIAVLVVGWALQTLAGKEAEALVQALTTKLLLRIERRLPIHQQERFAEETRAGLQRFSQKRPLWALLQAFSLFCAALTNRLTIEFQGIESAEVSKQEINDLAKALAHPLRIEILLRLTNGPFGHYEIARGLEGSLNLIAYHLRVLSKYGMVEVAETRQERGATLHIYRLTPKGRSPKLG